MWYVVQSFRACLNRIRWSLPSVLFRPDQSYTTQLLRVSMNHLNPQTAAGRRFALENTSCNISVCNFSTTWTPKLSIRSDSERSTRRDQGKLVALSVSCFSSVASHSCSSSNQQNFSCCFTSFLWKSPVTFFSALILSINKFEFNKKHFRFSRVSCWTETKRGQSSCFSFYSVHLCFSLSAFFALCFASQAATVCWGFMRPQW